MINIEPENLVAIMRSLMAYAQQNGLLLWTSSTFPKVVMHLGTREHFQQAEEEGYVNSPVTENWLDTGSRHLAYAICEMSPARGMSSKQVHDAYIHIFLNHSHEESSFVAQSWFASQVFDFSELVSYKSRQYPHGLFDETLAQASKGIVQCMQTVSAMKFVRCWSELGQLQQFHNALEALPKSHVHTCYDHFLTKLSRQTINHDKDAEILASKFIMKVFGNDSALQHHYSHHLPFLKQFSKSIEKDLFIQPEPLHVEKIVLKHEDILYYFSNSKMGASHCLEISDNLLEVIGKHPKMKELGLQHVERYSHTEGNCKQFSIYLHSRQAQAVSRQDFIQLFLHVMQLAISQVDCPLQELCDKAVWAWSLEINMPAPSQPGRKLKL